jgi:hypothetical protein
VKHEDRRKETGKMLMDIAKYFATFGLVGTFLVDKLTPILATLVIGLSLVTFVLGFYVIPAKKEGGR